MMFQSSALFPWLSVAENLAFGLAKKNLDRHGRQSQIEAIARQLQLEDLVERKARTLSGGQRQRVALGRALLKEAAVLLMDEPLSSLDWQLRYSCRDEILRLCRQRGQTALLVTHDQSEALNLADRLSRDESGPDRTERYPAADRRPARHSVCGAVYRRTSDQSVDSPQRCSSIDLSAFADSLAVRRRHCGDRRASPTAAGQENGLCFGI